MHFTFCDSKAVVVHSIYFISDIPSDSNLYEIIMILFVQKTDLFSQWFVYTDFVREIIDSSIPLESNYKCATGIENYQLDRISLCTANH